MFSPLCLVDYKEPSLILVCQDYPTEVSILVIEGILHECALSQLNESNGQNFSHATRTGYNTRKLVSLKEI